MNIAFVTSEYVSEDAYKGCGGLATYMGNITNILAANGHNIFVAVMSDRDEVIKWKENITVFRFNSEMDENSFFYKVYPFSSVYGMIWNNWGAALTANKAIKRICHENRIDVIQYTNLRGLNNLSTKKIPSVVRLSNNPIRLYSANDYEFTEVIKPKISLRDRLSLKALKRASYVFATCSLTANDVGKYIKRKIDVVESPFVLKKYNEPNEQNDRLALPSKYLLYFGNLGYYKGIREIVDGLEDFLTSNEDTSFVFCGSDTELEFDGQQMKASEYIRLNTEKVKNRVIILQPIGDKNVLYRVIRNSMFCVLPSRSDNLPNTCIEAMALKKIVIGTNGASFEQLIVDGKNGFLVSIGNSEELYEKINYVLSLSDDTKKEIEEAAAERILDMRPEIIYKKMIGIYESIIKK